MNVAAIKKNDIANGVGVRVSLFVSGCRHRCKNCFNKEAWDFDFGEKFTDETMEEIMSALDKDFISGLTILGGEPFENENLGGVLAVVKECRKRFPQKNIWCYTGFGFANDFLSGNGENEDIPEWFTSLCIDMHRIDFFSDKLTKGCMKTDKSYGYICHCFKKYLNTTPTDYINGIRLNYAGNLLLNSNMSVLDVSLECGFENLGHFYKLFKAKNGISPGKYKKLMQSKLII